MKTKIYYLIPDIHHNRFNFINFIKSISKGTAVDYIQNLGTNEKKAVGGLKVILQHCMMLRKNGFDVFAVNMGAFKGNVFNFDVAYIDRRKAKYTISEDDIVVATEFSPYDAFEFKSKNKILFMQNINGMSRLKKEDLNLDYYQIGFKAVITCSQFCTEYLRKTMGIKATTITNGIDTESFSPRPESTKKNQILFLPRKNPQDIDKIKALLKDSTLTFLEADGLTQEELILRYQESEFFVPTGYPEGFGLPPLEAMLCGCIVVGFTGGGAKEFMRHGETALVADDGDCKKVAELLLSISDDETRKNNIKKCAQETASTYTLERTEKLLVSFFNHFLSR